MNKLIFICITTFLILLFLGILLYSFRKTIGNIPVVISVFNCEEEIEYKMRNIVKNYVGCDIVVVDLGSDDNTVEIIKKLSFDFKNIRLIGMYEKTDGDIVSKTSK